MFGSKNKNQTAQTTSPLDQDFGNEFIHTMQDDLNPLSSLKTTTPQEKTISQKGVPTSSAVDASSPFFNQPGNGYGSSQQEPNKIFADSPASLEKKIETFSKEPVINEKSSLRKILFLFIFILIAGILASGGYYFWMTQKTSLPENPTPAETQPIRTTQSTGEEEVLITPIAEKYSYEKPNYLPVNIELASSEEIKRIVSTTAEEIKNIQTKTPFEFIVTDANNAPIAFPIFSLAANLNLAPELLIHLEESFSFYIYTDNGNARTGIVIELKNKDQALAELLKEEPTLKETLSFLFLSEPVSTSQTVFKSSEYEGIPIRYTNLNDDKSLSIDYTTYDNKLIIATSKDTIRAIIAKIIDQKSQSAVPTNDTQTQTTPN